MNSCDNCGCDVDREPRTLCDECDDVASTTVSGQAYEALNTAYQRACHEVERQKEHNRLLTESLAYERARRKEVQEACEKLRRQLYEAGLDIDRWRFIAEAALGERRKGQNL